MTRGDNIATACPPIAIVRSGTESTAATHKRCVMWRNSGFSGASPAVGVIGSSAMPQIGQAPGPSRTISGCIGQVHCTPAAPPAGSCPGFSET